MKRSLIVLAVFAALLTGSTAVHAAPPQTMNYQGYLTDSAGNPLSDSRKITFSIYTVNAGSVPLWTEVHPKVSVVRGQFSVTLGAGTPAVPLNLPFDRPYWLGVTIDLEKSEMSPRQPLTTAPYAFRATVADSVPGLSITTAGLADNAVTDVKIGGTITAAKLDLSGVVKKTGDSMSGPLVLPANGLTVGGNQLVATGGKVGIGGQPVNSAVFQVFNPTVSGQAALFHLSNTGNPLSAVYGITNGTGQAIYGLNTGTGRAGHFQIFNTGSSASALLAETNGTGFAGDFLGSVRVTGAITSTVPTGIAPFTIASATQVNNLNAGMVGGKSAGDFVLKGGDTMTGQLILPDSGVRFADNSTQTTAKTDCMGRYEDNGNGTVTDCRTGLIWLKKANCTDTAGGIVKSSGTLDWDSAVTWSAGLENNICGLTDGSSRRDWRMPTKTELMAMVANAIKQGFVGPVLTNSAGTAKWTQGDPFDNVLSNRYWSASPIVSSAGSSWQVNMSDGDLSYSNNYYGRNYVWPVRAGQ